MRKQDQTFPQITQPAGKAKRNLNGSARMDNPPQRLPDMPRRPLPHQLHTADMPLLSR
jgi:hypothetical protein